MSITTTFKHTEFSKIANNILNKSALMIKGRKFRILLYKW